METCDPSAMNTASRTEHRHWVSERQVGLLRKSAFLGVPTLSAPANKRPSHRVPLGTAFAEEVLGQALPACLGDGLVVTGTDAEGAVSPSVASCLRLPRRLSFGPRPKG